MGLPLALTLFRIFCIPALVAVILLPFRGHEIVSFALFFLASASDVLDGFWARRRRQTTPLGQLLDPIADKLLIASALICLVETGTVKAWVVVLIVGRELAVTGFRAIASSRGVAIPPSLLGKAKMVLETIVVAFLLLGRPILKGAFVFAQAGLWVVVALALASAAEYYLRYAPSVLSRRP